MTTYLVQYRVGINGRLSPAMRLRAKTPAGAIAQAAAALTDIDGNLTIIATPEA